MILASSGLPHSLKVGRASHSRLTFLHANNQLEQSLSLMYSPDGHSPHHSLLCTPIYSLIYVACPVPESI